MTWKPGRNLNRAKGQGRRGSSFGNRMEQGNFRQGQGYGNRGEHGQKPGSGGNQPGGKDCVMRFPKSGKIDNRKLKELFSLGRGEFYERLKELAQLHELSGNYVEKAIEVRMGHIGMHKIRSKWRTLAAKQRVLERVLKGEPREKFAVAMGFPETRQEMEKELAAVKQEIKAILARI